MPFAKLKAWLELWGLSPCDDKGIPYPSMYYRMMDDCPNKEVQNFILEHTSACEGYFYFWSILSWEDLEAAWNYWRK